MESVIVGQFISTLMSARTQAHIYHLQTPSFAAHKALKWGTMFEPMASRIYSTIFSPEIAMTAIIMGWY